ncbi:hypothetical protein [Dokdonella sp.]|uniref:hypothetical protein n=1 Tax=Dokdonella sp. TaxID=2291710 RepID=UPI00352878C0
MFRILVCAIPLMSILPAALAADVKQPWSQVPIFPHAPLEAKLGTFTLGADPDVLAVVLWNDRVNNRLDAIRIPPPYDGTGITSTPLENTATLFALGDICTQGTNVVVPYIKNFNIEVARFNGSTWSTSTIPGTTTNSFTTADCAVTHDSIVVSGQDFNDQEVEIFRSTTGGASYTFYGRYSNAVGPFSGAPRDQLLAAPTSQHAFSLSMTPTGQVRVAEFNLDASPAVFTQRNIINLPAPPGTFSVVRESAAGFTLAGRAIFTYNADDAARVVEFPFSNASAITTRNLGAINNSGSQFPFQGGGVVYSEGESSHANILWGDWFILSDSGGFTTDSSYPKVGIGGPVDGCAIERHSLRNQTAVVVPTAGADSTTLLFRKDDAAGIFRDGFESGDTSSWSCQ